jgi:colanic acid/amylovoran biosynthesis glycosyltransferase
MPLRIAYVVHMFPKVSETFIAHELAELRRRGVEVRVLSLLPPREELRHNFITASGLDELVSYEPADFDGILGEFKPDLLHAHFATEPTAAARELSARHDLPFTFTAHGYDIRRKPPADFAARAAAAQRVVTVSEANAQHIAEHHGVPREHIKIIPCGVDTETFCPRADEAASPGTPLIVCVARHVAVKNLGLLLEACALLHRLGVKFRCVSVGDGPLRGELEAKRAQLGLDEVVQFTGALTHEEVLPWWQRADVAVLTSENEGMPVCLMEAAACGVPAVATAVGGIPELVGHGTTGLLAPAGDAGALASALLKLIEQPHLRAKMGRAARQRAVERFSLSRQIDSLLLLWKEVVPCPTR